MSCPSCLFVESLSRLREGLWLGRRVLVSVFVLGAFVAVRTVVASSFASDQLREAQEVGPGPCVNL